MGWYSSPSSMAQQDTHDTRRHVLTTTTTMRRVCCGHCSVLAALTCARARMLGGSWSRDCSTPCHTSALISILEGSLVWRMCVERVPRPSMKVVEQEAGT